MAVKPTYRELEKRIQELKKAQSERERIESAPQVNQIRYQLLYEKVPFGYQSLDEDGNLIEVNAAWQKIFGYPREKVVGKSFGDLLHPDWKNHFKENFPRFKAVGEVMGVEFEMIKKDGSSILISFHGKIEKDQHGNFLRTHCILQDISKQKQMEEILAKKNNIMTTLIEHLPYPTMLIRKDRSVIFANRAAREVGAVVGGLCWRDFGHSDYISDEDKRYVNQHTSTPPNGIQCTFCLADTALQDKTTAIAPEIHAFGRIWETYWIFVSEFVYLHFAIDITERKRAEEDIKNLNTNLEKRVAERTADFHEANAALKILLKQREKDKTEVEKVIVTNIKELLIPHIDQLKKSKLNNRQMVSVDSLESNLNDILSPLVQNLSSGYLKLTPMEIQVANLIKHGKTSKEIAGALKISKTTVDTHRYNLRKKIGIQNQKANLRTYLLSLE